MDAGDDGSTKKRKNKIHDKSANDDESADLDIFFSVNIRAINK